MTDADDPGGVGTDGEDETGTDGESGTYTLVVERREGGRLEVGALGTVAFPAGWYAYVGSAQGPGGFARVDRHARVGSRESEGYHWHVDYLLGDEATDVDGDRRSPGADAECAVARWLATAVSDVDRGRVIDDFGASDCDCRSHLVYAPRRDRLVDAVDRAHRALGDG